MPRARVLIVEDESPMAMNIRARLEQMAYQVCSVVSFGAEAIKQAQELKPDIVLMDIVLQGDMDGIEAAQEIRSRLDIPVIYLTACTRDELVERAKLSEPYGYIVKPVEADELKAAIEVALHKHDREKELRQEIMQRKAAQEALAESEATLRRIIEDSSVPMAIINQDLRIEYLNKKFINVFGYTLQDIPTVEEWWSLAYPDEEYRRFAKSKWVERLENATMDKTEMEGVEARVICRDGTIRHVIFEMSPIHPQNLVILHDITDHRKAETATKQVSDELEIIFDSVPATIWYKDTGNNFIRVNKAAADLVGLRAEDINGKSAEELFPTDADKYYTDDLEVIDSGKPKLGIIEEVRNTSGEIRWVKTDKFPIRDDDGNITGILVFAIDITESKQTEKTIIQQNEFLNHIIESLTHPFYVLDANDYTIKIANSAAAHPGSLSPSTTCYELTHKESKPCDGSDHLCPVQVIKATGKTTIVEHIHYDKEGRPRHVEVHAHPIFDKDGNVVQVIEYPIDITDRKEMEEEKVKIEAQLRQAQKLEAMGALAGGIAHDFNNILSPILGYAEMALDEIPEDKPLHHDIQEIRKAGLRAKDLIKQILTFSRKKEQERIPVRASLVIKEALQLLRASLPTTIEIQTKISPEATHSTVFADPTQIHQILMNLCTNSAHAMRDKGGTLAVSLEGVELDSEAAAQYPDLEPGSYLQLSVSDTGHGMPADVSHRIFEPYFTTKAEGEGTGLGLAVIYGIVVSHGGAISVYSEPEKGTVFHILLPRIQSTDVPVTRTSKVLPTGHGRILVVDDEKTVIDLQSKMLARLGYEVVAKSSSTEALDAFRTQADQFDLVMTDQTMPTMTGAKLAKELLKIRGDIPIILCTGHSDLIDAEKAKAMGIRGFLMKPLTMKGLAETVSELIGKKIEERSTM